jgi:hypothetical protein
VGEDVVLWHYLMRQHGGFYVDVGAHHPHRLSNTALLHHYNGWTGINVEPDERLMAAFLQMRPNDINLAQSPRRCKNGQPHFVTQTFVCTT